MRSASLMPVNGLMSVCLPDPRKLPISPQASMSLIVPARSVVASSPDLPLSRSIGVRHFSRLLAVAWGGLETRALQRASCSADEIGPRHTEWACCLDHKHGRPGDVAAGLETAGGFGQV